MIAKTLFLSSLKTKFQKEEEEYNKWLAQQQPWAEANRDYVLAHLPEQMKAMLPAAKVAAAEVQPVVVPAPVDTASADSVNK